MRNYFLFLSLLVILTASCRRIRGNRDVITKQIEVEEFTSIESGSFCQVRISQGESTHVEISGESNIIRYITIKENNGILSIHSKNGLNLSPNKPVIVSITTPIINEIKLSGAGKIYCSENIINPDKLKIKLSGAGKIVLSVHAPMIDANLSGAGSLDITGETRDLNVTVSGAGSIDAKELKAENSNVKISGVGSADVYASMHHNLEVTGVGSINYYGEGEVIQKKSGVGSINKKD